jgi:pimeloyl-ACP methyl ester carboxylesterase
LADVCAHEGAVAVFGHSFGGLIALEAAAQGAVALPLVLYEPGVSVGGSLPATWVPHYRLLLQQERRRRAFSYFVKHSTGSPAIARHAPLWYLDLVLRAALRGHWAELDPLLEASADEHLIVASCDDRAPGYATISQPVLLMGGTKSPSALVSTPFASLVASLPAVDVRVLAGLDHFAPDDKAPDRVADEIDAFLRNVPVQGP